MLLPSLLFAGCPVVSWDETVRLKKINDGDTVTLENGRLVRLIGINTPEINHRYIYKSDPYAIQAQQLLAQYLRPGDKLHLVFDNTKQDKYGRMLAYVYSKTGRNLALLQLQAGYATQWVVGNNDKFWRCFQETERHARKRKKGIWKGFKPLSARQLTTSDKGYVYIQGRITDIQPIESGLQFMLDRRLLVSLDNTKLALFKKNGVTFLLHDRVLLNGKLSFSKQQPKMRLYHPIQILR